MTTSNDDRRMDTASLLIEASPERIYEALTDKAALEAWLPPAGMSGRFLTFDLREGGGYRLELIYLAANDAAAAKSTADSDMAEVRFVELVPNRRMVQAVDFQSDDPAFSGEMTMTWQIDPAFEGARVKIVAENVPAGINADDHVNGMTSSLGQLATFVTGQRS